MLGSTTTRNLSPKLTLDFHPFTDGTLLYAYWQKGFKSGGAMSLVNAAQATIQGLDFDIQWRLLPVLVPNLVLNLGGSYLDGKYDRFPDGSGYDEQTGDFFGKGSAAGAPPRDFDGHRTVRTPRFSSTLSLSQIFGLPGGSLELAGEVNTNSGYFYDIQNTIRQPSYTLLNAHASYLLERWNLRLTGFVKNIGNAVHYYQRFANDFGVNSSIAPPRTYGARLSWEF